MSAPIVVIEGPDGAGKTTLAGLIARELRYEVRHEGPPPPDRPPLQHYLERLYDAALSLAVCRGIVLDRFALGERVYGPILRGDDRLGAEGWRVVRRELDGARAYRILCLPPLRTCLDVWHSRVIAGLEYIRNEKLIVETYKAWEGFIDEPGQVVFDWTRHEADTLLHKIRSGRGIAA